MVKIWENNGTEEIGLVTPTPGLLTFRMLALSRSSCDGFIEEHAILLVQICEGTEHNSVSWTRKYLEIHLGKRKYICQMRNKCVHIERL